ncbi:MAG: M67 family metallopeptidase, partial [Thermomicrobiales bacterium]|nr:M67 family metallopeptidase [Thermomicrobiales bacterium]
MTPVAVTTLIIPRSVRILLVDHLLAAAPHEGCGLLATIDDGTDRRVMRWYPGENIDRSATRFTMDPRQVLDAIKEMRERDWHLGAIAHSHPRTAPSPSVTDLREAYYQDALLAIVSLATDVPELRVWDVRGVSLPEQARAVRGLV